MVSYLVFLNFRINPKIYLWINHATPEYNSIFIYMDVYVYIYIYGKEDNEVEGKQVSV